MPPPPLRLRAARGSQRTHLPSPAPPSEAPHQARGEGTDLCSPGRRLGGFLLTQHSVTHKRENSDSSLCNGTKSQKLNSHIQYPHGEITSSTRMALIPMLSHKIRYFLISRASINDSLTTE
ncbi:hypothetical protein MG293_012933 [Ovis ammon polii]|uniref:Uncharacterized protein n=1 Tax=Ovis ammon polii TaxID=230172 RepID=A0AAD4U315_OVIAM|nr:hypothetical protein MG293_012933 [Ovis ammon polii]